MLLNVLQTPAESALTSSTTSAIVLATSGERIPREAAQTGEGFSHLFLTLAEGDAELETESAPAVAVAALSPIATHVAVSAQGAIGLGRGANRNLSGSIHVAESVNVVPDVELPFDQTGAPPSVNNSRAEGDGGVSDIARDLKGRTFNAAATFSPEAQSLAQKAIPDTPQTRDIPVPMSPPTSQVSGARGLTGAVQKVHIPITMGVDQQRSRAVAPQTIDQTAAVPSPAIQTVASVQSYEKPIRRMPRSAPTDVPQLSGQLIETASSLPDAQRTTVSTVPPVAEIARAGANATLVQGDPSNPSFRGATDPKHRVEQQSPVPPARTSEVDAPLPAAPKFAPSASPTKGPISNQNFQTLGTENFGSDATAAGDELSAIPLADAPNRAAAGTPFSTILKHQSYFQSHVTSQIVEAAKTLSHGSVELTLSPRELGRINMAFTTAGDGTLQLIVAVERPETLDLLRRNADILLSEIKGLGYTESSLNFADMSSQSGADDDNEGPNDEHASVTRTEAILPKTPQSIEIDIPDGLDLRL